MNIYKHLSSLLLITVMLLGFSTAGFAQSKKEVPRQVKYISGKAKSRKIDASGRVVRRKSISLERSELSLSARNDLLEKETFDLINLKRLEIGLKKLTWNQKAADIARKHSENMARFGFFSHIGVNGRLVDSRATDSGLNDWDAIGENIAFNKGYDNPTNFAVERWMNSAGHKRNLLDGRWRESGLGIAVTKDGKYFFTQIFILK